MCTVTGLVLLVTGICGTSHDGAVLTMDAFASVFRPLLGEHLISLSILLFAFSTLVGWSFFGMECVRYIDSPWLSNLSGDLHRNDPSRLLLANADGVASVRSLQRASGHPQSFKSFSSAKAGDLLDKPLFGF